MFKKKKEKKKYLVLAKHLFDQKHSKDSKNVKCITT